MRIKIMQKDKSWENLKKQLVNALNDFIRNDVYLLENNVNERTISYKIGYYLTPLYSAFHVDCEYNRIKDKIKRLPQPEPTETNDIAGNTIFPDIIIHERGVPGNNLLVLEVKKEGNKKTDRDFEKLSKLTTPHGDYAYIYGLHLTFDERNLSDLRVYVGGYKQINLTEELKLTLLENGLMNEAK
jgi:hypothetical protein